MAHESSSGADRIAILRHHPVEEIRDIAVTIETALQKKYPNSFGHKRYETTEAYNHEWITEEYLFDPKKDKFPDFAMTFDGIDRDRLSSYRNMLVNRPAKTELPKIVGDSGVVRFEFLLDF